MITDKVYEFSDVATKKLGPVFDLVGVNKKHYSLLTKILSLLGTLKGRRYGKSQIQKFLKPIPKQHMNNLNQYLRFIFQNDFPESSENGILDNLIILFKTKKDLNQLCFSSMLRECFMHHSKGKKEINDKECKTFAKDFYYFLLQDEDFDEDQIKGMIDSCKKDGKIIFENIVKFYSDEDDEEPIKSDEEKDKKKEIQIE